MCPRLGWNARVGLALLFSLSIGAQTVHAATYTTVSDGSWTSSSTWSGGSKPGFRLSGKTVNVNHRITFGGDDLYVESGTLNVSGVLIIQNQNVKMESSSGVVNINQGVIILTNDNFENKSGTVNFNYGAIQACNGGYTDESGNGTHGNGYIYAANGNIEDKNSGNFSTDVAWCAPNGNGVDLPTSENCAVAEPPDPPGSAKRCENEDYYVTLIPSATVYDYGDAPASYGDAEHEIPSSPSVYLGTVVPDDEASSQNSADAGDDDGTGNDDEDAFNTLSDLVVTDTSYSLSVPCTGSGTVAGWIDFNLSGTFTNSSPDERASGSCSAGSADLTWSSGGGNFPATVSEANTFARLRFASNSAEVANATGSAGDGEVEDYPLAIVCDELSGDVSEVAAAVPVQSASGDKVFIASRSLSPAEGHLKAFSVNSDGSVDTTALWDAAALMDATERQNALYSTNNSGTLRLFNSLDAAAFAASGSPNASKIKEYTLDPSVDGGVYLAGRQSGSFLGSLSRGNDVGLITRDIDMGSYLNDAAYRTFYTGTLASRAEKVLATSDDGFLYAFNQSDGELSWGWTPRSLVQELKSYSTFQDNHFMQGRLDVIDAKSSGSYATYVVGGYRDGLGHYALKLDANGALDSLVWDEDRSAAQDTAPNHGEVDYFEDGSGNTYVTYVVTNGSNLSTLVIRNVADAGVMTEVVLNFNATSTPFVIPNFDHANAPAAKALYMGDSSGNIRRAPLLTSGSLESAANIKTALEGGTVGELGSTEAILFLGASLSSSDRQYYLRAQSESRITVLKYNASTTNWDKRWTSYVGGAGTWDSAGTFTADTSGVPADDDGDGIATDVTANGIQSLPTGARITDAAQIIADSVILPISVNAGSGCIGKAFFYLYGLTDGAFPDNKLLNIDGSKIDGDLFLGYGEPTRVEISNFPSKDQMIAHGKADQTPTNDTGVSSFAVNDGVSTGVRGWKELSRDN